MSQGKEFDVLINFQRKEFSVWSSFSSVLDSQLEVNCMESDSAWQDCVVKAYLIVRNGGRLEEWEEPWTNYQGPGAPVQPPWWPDHNTLGAVTVRRRGAWCRPISQSEDSMAGWLTNQRPGVRVKKLTYRPCLRDASVQCSGAVQRARPRADSFANHNCIQFLQQSF